MIPYVLFYLVGLCCCYLEIANKNACNGDLIIRKFFYFTFFIFFVLVAGLRYKIGQPDWNNYYDLYSIVDRGGNIPGGFELGYLFLNKVLSALSDEPQLLFLSTSVFSTIILFVFLNKVLDKQFIYLALTIYVVSLYFNLNMYVIRQQIAISFIMLAILFYYEDKKPLTFLMLIVASTFHQTSLIFLLLWPFLLIKYNKKLLITIYLIGFVFMLLKVSFADYVLDFLAVIPDIKATINLLKSIPGLGEERVGFIGVIERMLSFLFIVYYRDTILRACGTPHSTFVFNLFVLYNFISIFFFQYLFIVTRVNFYFSFAFPIMYAMTLAAFTRSNKIILFNIILIYTFIKGALVLSSQPYDEDNFVPYRSYFEVVF